MLCICRELERPKITSKRGQSAAADFHPSFVSAVAATTVDLWLRCLIAPEKYCLRFQSVVWRGLGGLIIAAAVQHLLQAARSLTVALISAGSLLYFAAMLWCVRRKGSFVCGGSWFAWLLPLSSISTTKSFFFLKMKNLIWCHIRFIVETRPVCTICRGTSRILGHQGLNSVGAKVKLFFHPFLSTSSDVSSNLFYFVILIKRQKHPVGKDKKLHFKSLKCCRKMLESVWEYSQGAFLVKLYKPLPELREKFEVIVQ